MKSILLPLAAALSLGASSCTNVKIAHADIYPSVRERCAKVLNNGFPGPSGVVLGANGNNTYYSSGEESQSMSDEERARLEWIQKHGIGYGTSYSR